MLEADSRERYLCLRKRLGELLTDAEVPHFVPEPLPSEMYADASHPLGEGYDLLALRMLDENTFRDFIEQ